MVSVGLGLRHRAIFRTCTEASVFLLFRYNPSIPSIKEQKYIWDRFPSLQLDWLTVYRSKGREADVVIVGDLSGGQMGFPFRKDDDPVITPLLPPSEKFAFAEERRLFYVAMTRARCELILMVNNCQGGWYLSGDGEVDKLDGLAVIVVNPSTPSTERTGGA